METSKTLVLTVNKTNQIYSEVSCDALGIFFKESFLLLVNTWIELSWSTKIYFFDVLYLKTFFVLFSVFNDCPRSSRYYELVWRRHYCAIAEPPPTKLPSKRFSTTYHFEAKYTPLELCEVFIQISTALVRTCTSERLTKSAYSFRHFFASLPGVNLA